MIDPKELKIGNWVTCNYPVGTENDIVLIVDGRDECVLVRGNYLWVRKSILAPIPLTSEIMIGCGFKKHKNSNEYWSHWHLKNGWRISGALHNEPSAGVEAAIFYWSDKYISVKYLHQLQNLYFSLTGEELEINL
jgi:hypothetical protein